MDAMAVTGKQPVEVVLVCNACSGNHSGQSPEVIDQVEGVLKSQGAQVERLSLNDPSQLSETVRQVVARDRQPDVVVAVGGDGTINTVAQQLMHSRIALGIIPMGTFNYMARALGIPPDPLAAAQVMVSGQRRAVHVGQVNQWIYVNNASIGLYPYLIEQREQDNKRFGRLQAVAKLSGFVTLLRTHRNLRLRMRVDGLGEPVVSPVIFFGNNQLQLADMKLSLSECAAAGRLAVIAVRPVKRLDMLRLMVRMQLGTFEQAPEVEAFCADEVVIDSRQASIRVAIDGEVRDASTPLTFRVAREALQVMVPDAAAPV